ncbi:hypothetical protein PG985_003392 [Apiospora marii]|uniref:Uncharacterized protein n=1 Tax=Apiospora marii TaxID=335849 RepID=A0ABR1RVH3_9PEZI
MEQHATQSHFPTVTQVLMFCRNQDAPRNYTQVMLCFPADDAEAALDHLEASVKFLQTNYAFLNARLGPGPDPHRLYLSRSPEYELP